MVFESLVTDLLNRFLGSYVENLDSKQLKLGIWGGDVVLNNLIIKPSVVDDLDLPISIVYGCIGKLVLKIPWKDLYGSPLEVSVENIYLLVVPNNQIAYNAEKEEKLTQEAKQAEIAKVELALKKEEEKDKPKPDDTFTEKLVARLIRNIQVKISNIHIRYEDKTTNVGSPFAFGITLGMLNVETTDENWVPTILKDNAVNKVFKRLELECLAFYWNCSTVTYSHLPPTDLVNNLTNEVVTKSSQPSNYRYILGPINSSARLRVNMKPEFDTPQFSIPKVNLNVEMEQLSLGVSKTQYRDIITVANTMDLLSKGLPYRKFRPNVPSYRGYYKEWWHFAYQCVLVDIHRKKRNWDWNHICGHRSLCREYADLYQTKLTTKSLPQQVQDQLQECEKKLDVLNIVMIRRRIELEVKRLSEQQEKMQKKSSWLGSWFGGSSAKKEDDLTNATAILKKFEEAMTPAEKERLYKAIDYQENAAPAEYPKEFVGITSAFVLRSLAVELRDDESPNPRVLNTELKGVKLRVDLRPAASALKVAVNIDSFTTFGLEQDNCIPELITSKANLNNAALLDVLFETNPLNENYGQKIHVTCLPLRITYDAETINKAVDIFTVPESTALDQLSSVAGSGLTNIKEMSATGLQHTIDQHTHMNLKIDLHAPIVIIPYGGFYTGNENSLILNLGRVNISTEERVMSIEDVRKMHQKGANEEEILKEMIAQSYDHFILELTELQLILAQSDEDWETYIKQTESTQMHILNPVNLQVKVSVCMITDDPRLPHNKISGTLPSINLNLTDARLLLLLGLIQSIPFAETEIPESEPLSKQSSRASSTMLTKYAELQEMASKSAIDLKKKQQQTNQFVQFTIVDLKFVMSELSINFNHQEHLTAPITQMGTFSVTNLEADLLQQTYNTDIKLRLASIDLKQYRDDSTINIISTPSFQKSHQYLFLVNFVQVNRKSPEFHTKYKSCESVLNLQFGALALVLHVEGLQSLIKYATDLQEEVDEIYRSYSKARIVSSTSHGEMFKRQLSAVSESFVSGGSTIIMPSKKKSMKDVVVETIMLKINAQLEEVAVMFASDKQEISVWSIKGITAEVIMKKPYTQVNAKLLDLAIKDLNPQSIHKDILTVSGDCALNAQIVMYNLETEEDVSSNQVDMSVDATMGCLRIVFLNWYVSTMLDFLSKFQTAQDTIVEASTRAAQSAKQNVQIAYEKATKIALNINLKAPDIVVPVDSKSRKALLLDMGYMTLTNTFLTLDVKDELKVHSAVIDEMKMKLTHFKLSSIELNESLIMVHETVMLEPVTFILSVKRNLSASWYKVAPDLAVSGQIKTIKLLLRQDDYKMIMNTLSGNLAEGNPTEPQKPAIAATASTVRSEASLPFIQSRPSVDVSRMAVHVSNLSFGPSASGATEKEISEEKVHIFLKFTFTMESLIIDLFTSQNKSDPSPQQELESGLGRFSLEGLSVKGKMMSDDSMVVSLLLVNCLLDDLRKGRETKLNRLIERSIDTGAESAQKDPFKRSMIDVTYQQSKTDAFADVRIYSFTVILSVDYLLKVAEFFTADTPPPKETDAALKVHKVQSSRTVVAKSEPVLEQKEQRLTLNLKVEKPDIILVEHMDNIDTNALILNTEIVLNMRMTGDHQVIMGVIRDLQLYTCCYNPARRADTRGDVLYPVTISVAGSTPEGKGLHIEVIWTDVHIRVSPDTIELLNRVSVTMSGGTSSSEDGSDEDTDYSNLWDMKPFGEADFWFLKTDVADEALDLVGQDVSQTSMQPQSAKLEELCIVSMPSFILTLEAGVGNKTLPMLLLESSFQGNVHNWSSQINIEASLSLQMGYYNSQLALWEPLVEPVEVTQNDKSVFVPWELKLEMSMNEQDENVLSPSSETGQPEVQPQASTCITITSSNNLELTVTKTCLDVLNNLGKALANAMKTTEVTKIEYLSPYKLVNESGIAVTLDLDKGSFLLHESEESKGVILESHAEVALILKPSLEPNKTRLKGESILSAQITERVLCIKVKDMNCELELPVMRADKRFFWLNYRAQGKDDNWGLISTVKVENGVTIITLRSILQVQNHFNVPVEVYYMTPKGDELESIAVVEPGTSLNVPLKAVYTPPYELFFSVSGYSVTCVPYIWKNLQQNLAVTKVLQCPAKPGGSCTDPFIIKAVGETEQIYYENTNRHTMASTCYNIHLYPAFILKNCLPVDIICCGQSIEGEITVKVGDTLQLPNIDPGKSYIVIRLPDYLEKEWSCRHDITSNPPEFSVWQFDSHDSAVKMTLDLGMHVLNKHGTLTMSLYCPFWMLNKTGLMLGYRKSKKTEKNEASGSPAKSGDENLNILHHPANFKGPILFSFNAKNFFGKKKASVRIDQGEWSDKFSLDVAGSSGVVVCKANNLIYQIGVHNQLTYNGLTKQVTFTPYYVIINNANFAIECQELDRPADPWIHVEPNSCTALWPKSERDDKLLKLRIVGSREISAPFLFTESHTTLLKLKNKYGGVNVDIQMTEGAVYINLTWYQVGMAPALVINHTEDTMNFWEKETVQIRKLLPNHSFLYTWENPSGPRVLVWETGHKKEIEDDLRKDEVGEFSPMENLTVYWVSFLDGMQRVLLFTTEKSIAEEAQSAKQFELVQQEISMSIHGLGLSLVNNITRQEIMYIGIASSGIIWEACKTSSKRFKQMSEKDSRLIENAYQQYLVRSSMPSSSTDINRVNIDGKIEVDFEAGYMLKPNKRKIRRTFMTGVWLQMKSSPTQLQLHAKINRLQIDNQMYDCIFPVVLAPVPPPKSVAADLVHKPFAEVSIVQLLIKHSQIQQFKYFKVLIQEFHVKVDLGFINALVDILQSAESTEQEEKQLFLKDLELVDDPLYAHVSTQSLQEQKSFYDLLHFSPLKIHVSFSLASTGGTAQDVATPNFLNVLLQGLGVTLTDMNDVIFKLAYFEREYTFLTQRQLISETTSHYVGQLVKQLYVLVLGLDVLGNPYGLVLGLTKGVEDLFYEPFQGAIQGPGEFAEGLVLGVRSLFGHTVGGAAGAVSRITGAMGKGIAALTFDKDYQRKRRDQINKKPASVQEGIARGGKGIVMGVYDGVTGVFTKPIAGAKEQGVEGFFTGLGKGAVGLITRPTAGVIDFASGSLEAVKRATEMSEEANRLRPPRVLQADNHVRPYNRLEAEGNKLLMDMEKGKYATTDVYSYHFTIIPKKEILLLTDKRLAYVTHNDIFGGWQVEWSYTWQEIQNPPKIVPKGISIVAAEGRRKKLGLFGSSDNGKVILVPDSGIREEIFSRIEALRGKA